MNGIEEKFYKTFGIEKKVPCEKCSMNNTNWNCKRTCLHNDEKEKRYPELTDRILLELICILRNYYMLIFWRKDKSRCLDICADEYTKVLFRTGGDLKYIILNACIWMKEEDKYNKEFKHQVQSLFTEGEE